MKRALDIVIAGVALVVLSPILAGLALTVRLALGRPVLFRQTRPGLHGKPFTLYKFRSMTPPADGTAAGDERFAVASKGNHPLMPATRASG